MFDYEMIFRWCLVSLILLVLIILYKAIVCFYSPKEFHGYYINKTDTDGYCIYSDYTNMTDISVYCSKDIDDTLSVYLILATLDNKTKMYYKSENIKKAYSILKKRNSISKKTINIVIKKEK